MSEEIEISEEVQEPQVRWITFYLGDERFAVQVEAVREILRVNNILPVPGADDFILGITNIRGSVVTVIDGRSRFMLPEKEQDDLSRIIVIEHDDEAVGVLVDSVSDVVDLPMSAIDANPKMNNNQGTRYINGVVSQNDGLIIILNVDRFMGEDDEEMVVGF